MHFVPHKVLQAISSETPIEIIGWVLIAVTAVIVITTGISFAHWKLTRSSKQ